MKITFRDFRSAMLQDGCSEAEIRHLYGAVKAMDPESRGWVVRWFCTGAYPDTVVEDVTAEYLVENCGYKPINAFILLDWLKSDPQAAKYFAMKIPSTISPSETIGPEIEQLLAQEGIQPASTPQNETDESDIVE